MSKNILIIGSIQSGKSSFIGLLHDYFNLVSPSQLVIGNGSVACSTDVTNYPIDGLLTKPKFILPKNEEELYELTDVDYQQTGETIKLNLIDTPGLDDGSIVDEQTLQKILSTINSLPSITAVIFVKSRVSPISNSFKKCIHKYLTILYQVPHKIFVHTKYHYNDYNPSNKTELESLLDEELGNKFSHFYVDNLALRRSTDACSKLITYSTLYVFFHYLNSLSDIPVDNLLLSKTSDMKYVDELIKTNCQGRIGGLITYSKIFDTGVGELTEKYGHLIWEKLYTQAEVDKLQEYCTRHDTEEEIMISSSGISDIRDLIADPSKSWGQITNTIVKSREFFQQKISAARLQIIHKQAKLASLEKELSDTQFSNLTKIIKLQIHNFAHILGNISIKYVSLAHYIKYCQFIQNHKLDQVNPEQMYEMIYNS